MFRQICVIFLLGHILGDFYFQSSKMAEEKEKIYSRVVLHSGIYCLLMLLVSLVNISLEMIIAALALGISHFAVDSLKYMYTRTHKNNKKVFIVDQLIHFVCIFTTSIILTGLGVELFDKGIFSYVDENMGVKTITLLSWFAAILIIHKPANIMIQKLTGEYRPKESGKKKTIEGAGRNIGTVERLVMLIFLSMNQFAAIGLVLTAKSIARYDKISKDQSFAEYYLLGTLLSTLIVIVTAVGLVQ